MKPVLQIFICLVIAASTAVKTNSQEIPEAMEQQLENQAGVEDADAEEWVLQFAHLKKHPLNLNEVDAMDLKEFFFLTPLQVGNFISYRQLLGKLVSIYELQAIPGWDLPLIRKILPYVSISLSESVKEGFAKRINKGEQVLLFRMTEVLERSKGFKKVSTGNNFLGSPEKLFFRYRYQYKNLLQFGITAEKDAGESFFKDAQKSGFDFYSAHLFARDIGKVKALVLGDFTVNLGQGLIQWQSLAYKKSSEVISIKRQSAILHPYSSSGEFYFQRGAGVTIQNGKMEITAFGSSRKISANLNHDSLDNKTYVSSFLTSGYHRTVAENKDRNNLGQNCFGGNINYHSGNFYAGINAIAYHFSLPIRERDEAYKMYAITGKSWNNFSIDYSYTFRNFHFFGEAAVDKNFNQAFVNGLLLSVDPRVELSILHRSINKEYQAVYANAFTENTNPNNEKGLFTGICIRPSAAWKLDMYADIFMFSWLKYLVDAPSGGKDFLLELSYLPSKQVEIYSKFRSETKDANLPGNISTTNHLVTTVKRDWRTQVNFKLSASLTIRNRIELLWLRRNAVNFETGFMEYVDIFYKPSLKKYSASFRVANFETSSYESRIYAFENDVLYSNSILPFYDKGYRYYLNLNWDVRKNISVWFRCAQTIYLGKKLIGSGLDEIPGNRKTEIKFQLTWRH